MNRFGSCLIVLAILTGADPVSAGLVTFDELPAGTVVDGMVIGNVTFGFSSTDATIGGGPGITNFVAVPNIEGDASETLTLSFATPVFNITYGFALSTNTPIDPGTTIEIFATDASSLGSFTAAAGDFGFGFVEGENSAFSGMPIGSAEITFANATSFRFAFDNLTFRLVPEPSTLAFALLGLLGMSHRRRKRV